MALNFDKLYNRYVREYTKHVITNASMDIDTEELVDITQFRTAYQGIFNDIKKETGEHRGSWKTALKRFFDAQRIGIASTRQVNALLRVSNNLQLDYTFDDIMYHKEVKDALLNAIKFRGEELKAKGFTGYQIREAIKDEYFYVD